MWKIWKVWVLIGVLLLGACSSNEASKKEASHDMAGRSSSDAKMENAKSSADQSSGSAEKNENKQSLQDQRKVIYTAELRITVEKLQNAMDTVRKMVDANGGYIVESNTNTGDEGYQDGMMSVRVPMNGFRPFLEDVKELSEGSPHESVRGEDVTEEYVDLSSRLKAKQQVRSRLESFMNKAERTEDLLKISSDLARVQEEIEQLEGRLNFLKNQSDYSTVTIQFEVKNLKAEKLQTEDLNTWKKTRMLFMETVNFFVSAISFVFVALFGLAPLWIVSIPVVYWIWRRKKGQKKKPGSPTSME